MTNSKLLSIVIPFYNVEEYIEECLVSVIEQITDEVEIVLVNDGSTDDSMSIVTRITLNIENIKIYSQNNQGVSSARNKGIENSIGKYILFIDSDDSIESGSLKCLIQVIKNSDFDLISFEMNRVVNNNVLQKEYEIPEVTEGMSEEVISSFVLKNDYIPWAPFQSVYSKKFINDNGIRFDKDRIMAEDADFYFQIISKGAMMKFIDLKLVKYIVSRPGSATSTINFKKLEDQVIVFTRWRDFFNNRTKGDSICIYLDKKIKRMILSIRNINKSEKHDFLHLLKSKVSPNLSRDFCDRMLYCIINFLLMVYK